MDVKKLLVNMGLLGLFVFGMMAFMITTQSDNSVSNPLTNDSRIGNTYSTLEGNLTNAKSTAQTSSDSFGNVTPTQEFGELEVTSIVSPTKVAKTIIVGFWNTFLVLPTQILNPSGDIIPVVFGLLGAILLIFLIIGVWAIWKGVIS